MNQKHIVVLSLLLISATLMAQTITDPQILAEQKLQEEKANESGYADIEIDNLHRKIKKQLPILMTTPLLCEQSFDKEFKDCKERYRREENGKKVFVLKIATGESIKSISERYIYDGYVYLFTDAEGKSLSTVMLRFERTNPFGAVYQKERRELINNSPNWFDDEKQIDKNDDVILVYYETEISEDGQKASKAEVNLNEKPVFKEKYRMVLKDIEYFQKKLRLIETYKKYLRRAHKIVNKKVYDIELKDRVRVQKMLDFK